MGLERDCLSLSPGQSRDKSRVVVLKPALPSSLLTTRPIPNADRAAPGTTDPWLLASYNWIDLQRKAGKGSTENTGMRPSVASEGEAGRKGSVLSSRCFSALPRPGCSSGNPEGQNSTLTQLSAGVFFWHHHFCSSLSPRGWFPAATRNKSLTHGG